MTKELIELSDLDSVIEKELSDLLQASPSRKNAIGKTVTDYVDNNKLYEEIKPYIYAYREAKANDTPLPRVPEYVGKCIMLIAERMATRPNFSRYPFKEEMIGDAILNTLKYIYNFNPDKYNKPFAYISRQVWNAFIARIELEKTEMATKIKKLNSYGLLEDAFEIQDQDDGEEYHNTFVEHLQQNSGFLTEFEEKQVRKREIRRQKRQQSQTGLEAFMQDGEDENSDL